MFPPMQCVSTQKGPENPTCEKHIPIISNSCESGMERAGDTKEMLEDRLCERVACESSCVKELCVCVTDFVCVCDRAARESVVCVCACVGVRIVCERVLCERVVCVCVTKLRV